MVEWLENMRIKVKEKEEQDDNNPSKEKAQRLNTNLKTHRDVIESRVNNIKKMVDALKDTNPTAEKVNKIKK